MPSDAAKTSKYFCFTVGTSPFAVPLSDVTEVLFIAELSLQAGMPSEMAGYLNRRGEPTPIYHLSALLQLDAISLGLYDHILIMTLPTLGCIGLLTSGVHKILEIPASALIAKREANILLDVAKWVIPEGSDFVPLLTAAIFGDLIAGTGRISDRQVA